MRAISQHASQPVTFTPPTGAYNFGVSDTRDLNQLYPGTTVSAVAPANPTFDSRGTANGTTITLTNNGVTKQVEVTAIGRVKIL